MDNNEFCPLPEECPVYMNNTTHNEMVGLTYRSLYCLQGNKKYKSCKRYQAFMQLGKPAHRMVLPNSSLSLDEIARHHD
jgi:hypothetical protein